MYMLGVLRDPVVHHDVRTTGNLAPFNAEIPFDLRGPLNMYGLSRGDYTTVQQTLSLFCTCGNLRSDPGYTLSSNLPMGDAIHGLQPDVRLDGASELKGEVRHPRSSHVAR